MSNILTLLLILLNITTFSMEHVQRTLNSTQVQALSIVQEFKKNVENLPAIHQDFSPKEIEKQMISNELDTETLTLNTELELKRLTKKTISLDALCLRTSDLREWVRDNIE